MRVIIVPDAEKVTITAYETIRDRLNNWEINAMGFDAGGLPVELYDTIIQGFKQGELDFNGVSVFNLDEFLGLPDNHPRCHLAFLEQHLYNHVNIDPQKIHYLEGLPEDIEAECMGYEEDIAYVGGIKLQLLGIGRQGQLGFNGPGSSLMSRTRLVTLSPEAIEDKAPSFRRMAEVPCWALSMGVGTIMECSECLLVASGAEKAEAVAAMVEGPLSASCPASALQNHEECTVIIDEAAAANLRYAYIYRNEEQLAPMAQRYLTQACRRTR